MGRVISPGVLMRFSQLSAIVLFALSPWLRAADFGDQEYNWSTTAAQDFQDYYTRSLNRKSAVINDYWLHYWLQQRLLQLNVRSPDPIGSTETFILKAATINAYAMPGNVIALYAGLIATTDTEDELVSVLAHEMSHIALDHFTRIAQNNDNQALKILAGMALAVVLAQQSVDAANAALLGSMASTIQGQLTFSQSMEMEADQLAQDIIKQTPYDNGAGARFFMKLYAEQGGQLNFEYLRSHPLGITRSAKLADEARSEERPPSATFKVLQAYISYLTGGPYNAVAMKQPVASASPDTQYAFWLNQRLANGDATVNLTELTRLVQQYPTFLPARFTLLQELDATNSSHFCPQLETFEKAIDERTLTLDVLNLLADGANHCQLNSTAHWQAQRLWQSGREEEAMAYLNRQINKSTDANQAARLNTQLATYNRRYERFR